MDQSLLCMENGRRGNRLVHDVQNLRQFQKPEEERIVLERQPQNIQVACELNNAIGNGLAPNLLPRAVERTASLLDDILIKNILDNGAAVSMHICESPLKPLRLAPSVRAVNNAGVRRAVLR